MDDPLVLLANPGCILNDPYYVQLRHIIYGQTGTSRLDNKTMNVLVVSHNLLHGRLLPGCTGHAAVSCTLSSSISSISVRTGCYGANGSRICPMVQRPHACMEHAPHTVSVCMFKVLQLVQATQLLQQHSRSKQPCCHQLQLAVNVLCLMVKKTTQRSTSIIGMTPTGLPSSYLHIDNVHMFDMWSLSSQPRPALLTGVVSAAHGP